MTFSGPPHVHPLGDLRAVVGKEFSVVCPASGYPIDKITWTKGKKWLSADLMKKVNYKPTPKRGTKLGKNKCIVSNIWTLCSVYLLFSCAQMSPTYDLEKTLGFEPILYVRASLCIFLDTTLRNCVRYKPCLLGNRFYGMMLENNEEKRGLGTN